MFGTADNQIKRNIFFKTNSVIFNNLIKIFKKLVKHKKSQLYENVYQKIKCL